MIIKLDGGSRLTIPKIIRETLGLKKDGKVKLILEDDKLIIVNPDKTN